VALEAHDVRRLQQIGAVLRAVDIVAAKARDATAVHYTGNKIVALHSILVRGAVREVHERSVSEFVLFRFPEVA
jgi:hypothetical protein